MTVIASKFAAVENDLYETPTWAVRALLRRLPVAGKSVWEPAAGNHRIVDVLREAGADLVIASDIATYGRPHTFEMDFLAPGPPTWPIRTDLLITNPPYGPRNRDAVKFARLALERCDGWVALLLTGKIDFGRTRADLFANNPRFAFKIALVDRIKWFEGTEFDSSEVHAWYVWEPTAFHLWRSPKLFYEGRNGPNSNDKT